MERIKVDVIIKGLALGNAFFLKRKFKNQKFKKNISQEEQECHIQKIKIAYELVKNHLNSLINKAQFKLLKKDLDIFEVQLFFLESSIEMILILIRKNLSSYQAVNEFFNDVIQKIKYKKNKYQQDRILDIEDLKNNLIEALDKGKIKEYFSLYDDAIIVTEELMPFDIISLSLKKTRGFIVERGSITSHSTIIAKSLDLPLIRVNKNIILKIEEVKKIVIDGNSGYLFLDPDKYTEDNFNFLIEKNNQEKLEYENLRNKEFITKDNVIIDVLANINQISECEKILDTKIKGIGLFRTEFLYISKNRLLNEDEEYYKYREIIKYLRSSPVTIRTLDLGGDKNIFSLNLENNDSLGLIGSRLYKYKKDIIIKHFKAILRASNFGYIKVMLPMLTTIEEFLYIKNDLFKRAKKELDKEKKDYNKDLPFGIMVETPAVAIMIDKFLDLADFFSIGTNDLTQYVLATDRNNINLTNLYSTFDPSVLRLLYQVAQKVNIANKDLNVCGEFAHDISGLLILMSLGIKKISVSTPYILKVKKYINKINYNDLIYLKEKILNCSTKEQVINLIENYRNKNGYI